MEKMEQVEFVIDGRKSLPRVALVLNEEYDLLGMVRRRDILRGLDPDFLVSLLRPKRKLFAPKGESSEVLYQKIVAGIRNRTDRPVTDVMSPIKTTIDYDDSINKGYIRSGI